MSRPSNDQYYMAMAHLVASRGTCIRRKVGAVLIDQHNRVLSTGFNGVAPGAPHCIDSPCGGHDAPSGTGLSKCRSSHAEAAALLHCPDVYKIKTLYVTTSPCADCVKLLLLTSCERIVFSEEYADQTGKNWWLEDHRQWRHFTA